MEHSKQIEIWFFIGALLLAYGILITGEGIYHFFVPQLASIALSELHADIWWGILLLVVGLFYSIKFWPFGAKQSDSAD